MGNTSPGQPSPARAAADGSALTKLIYQSNAATTFSPEGLGALLDAAVTRNAAEQLTGTLVYDQGRFMQWLEGPRASLDRVVSSIRSDPRHTDFEVLRSRPIDQRAFSRWSMRLAVRRSGPSLGTVKAVRTQDAPLDALLSYPDAASSLFRGIFGNVAANDDQPVAIPSPGSAALRGKIETLVAGPGFTPLFDDPQPDAGSPETMLQLEACAHELARLFTTAREDVDPRRIEAICRTSVRGMDDFVRLFGRTAAELGDLWQADRSTEADIAVALAELQIVYSRMRRQGIIDPDRDISDFRILVAQMPGDLHIVGAILKADILRSRGWDAALRFPATRDELIDELRASEVDGLVIATSRVLSGGTPALDRMRDLIDAVRKASRNPDIVIIVGGRIFAENPDAWRGAGADGSAASPLGLSSALRGLLVV